MKRLLLLGAFLCTALFLRADGKSLFITFYDGSKKEFPLSKSPKITMGNDKLNVKCGDTTHSYELWHVTKFTYGATTSQLSGDANGDGTVDAADVVAIVDNILGKTSADFNGTAADVNGDGTINAADAIGIVNIILKK